MDWMEKPGVKKGTLGENIVDEWLLASGYIPYRPIADCAHPFDRLVASKDRSRIVIVEVKTKPRRNYYPDTGINLRHYDDYLRVSEKHKIQIFLAFVDEKECSIYGEFLSELNKPRVVKHRGCGLQYPMEWDRIIYFPLVAMRTIFALTQEQADSLAALRRSANDQVLAAELAAEPNLFDSIYGIGSSPGKNRGTP